MPNSQLKARIIKMINLRTNKPVLEDFTAKLKKEERKIGVFDLKRIAKYVSNEIKES